MADLLIYETGNGGDLRFAGADLEGVAGFENLPYLALFSGTGWWGNALLLGNEDPSCRFTSETEQVLQQVALNSAGRIRIEAAVKKDLAFLKGLVPGTTVEVSAAIVSDDRLQIRITVNGQAFYYNWNPGSGFLNYQV